MYVCIKYKYNDFLLRKLTRALDHSSGFKNSCGTRIFQEIVLCRFLHLLVKQYNKMMQTLLFLMLITCDTTEIISATNIIHHSSSQSIPLPLKIFFAVASIQTGITILVAFGFTGDFYKESYKSLAGLKKENRNVKLRSTRQEKKYRKTFLISCQVQKIQFGMSNFIEKTTPPIFQLYCMNRIIDLLLVR